MTAGSRKRRSREVARGGHGYIPLLRRRNGLEQPLDEGVRRDALGLGVEVRDDAVPQHRARQRVDVGDRHVIAAVHQRPRLPGEDERLRGAQPGAPLHPLADELVIALASRPRRVHQPHRVARHVLGDDDLPHQLLDLEDLGAARAPATASWVRTPVVWVTTRTSSSSGR